MIPSKQAASDCVNSFDFVIRHFSQEVLYNTVKMNFSYICMQ